MEGKRTRDGEKGGMGLLAPPIVCFPHCLISSKLYLFGCLCEKVIEEVQDDVPKAGGGEDGDADDDSRNRGAAEAAGGDDEVPRRKLRPRKFALALFF
jgi:hypothetical protein